MNSSTELLVWVFTNETTAELQVQAALAESVNTTRVAERITALQAKIAAAQAKLRI